MEINVPVPDVNVTVTNPDDPSGSPAYDGPARLAHTKLAPGGYEATDADGTEWGLLVSDTRTVAGLVVDIDRVHNR